MNIVFIGTYPPRECGIGIFTQNLYRAIVSPEEPDQHTSESDAINGYVVAMSDHGIQYPYPSEVKLIIRQEQQRDYLEAVTFINHSSAEVCILEHEFGIFGGQNGIYILPLLHRLEIPLIVTLHTIVLHSSYTEKAVLSQICKMAHKIIVMSHKAVEFLVDLYGVPPEKIVFIEHGVPDIRFNQESAKKEFKLESKKLLLTFGILSRNKGIETVLKALPKVIAQHPDVMYMVLGKTHPNVLHHSGEEYRNYLQLLVKTLNLREHVVFINEFIGQKELFKYLSASDIYITPYLNEAQITSGTLSYAIGVGTTVLSTPYWHATELLAEGRGQLFDFNNVDQLTDMLLSLLDDPKALQSFRKKAYDYGRTITWEKSGQKYIAVIRQLLDEKPIVISKSESLIDPLLLPPFSLDHIIRLTDDTGIIQHAKFGIPNLKEGYCLDDNARALLMVLMAYSQTKDKVALCLAPIYLSYIHYMQNPDGTFRNFLSFNRMFLDEVGSDDSFGRTIWALGYLLANAPNDAYFQTGRLVFFDSAAHFEKLKSIRGIANTILGICYYLRTNPSDEGMKEILRNLTTTLVRNYQDSSSAQWHWFEPLLAYDNGILPLALWHASEFLNDDTVLHIAKESMDFLEGITLRDGYLSVVGNEKWYTEDDERSMFAQQPIDAMAMVLMYQQAYRVTKDREYLTKLFSCFMWFLGENDLRISLFDFDTKGCCDGIESYGINRNQGAESSLAYLISYITVLQAFERFEETNVLHPILP